MRERNWQLEWETASELKGLRTTNMQSLLSSVGYCYLHCPEEWQDAFCALIIDIEIRTRHMLWSGLPLKNKEKP